MVDYFPPENWDTPKFNDRQRVVIHGVKRKGQHSIATIPSVLIEHLVPMNQEFGNTVHWTTAHR